MTPIAQKIADLERITGHLERFINDKSFRQELGRNFKGFGLSGDDVLNFEALTEYTAILKQQEAAT
jgi:hypothetical protein